MADKRRRRAALAAGAEPRASGVAADVSTWPQHFLDGLQITQRVVRVHPADARLLARADQLALKASRCNTAGPDSVLPVAAWAEAGCLWALELKDRFGDLGTVAVAAVLGVRLEFLAVACRALPFRPVRRFLREVPAGLPLRATVAAGPAQRSTVAVLRSAGYAPHARREPRDRVFT